jgi:lysine-specific demethylase 8
MIECNYSPPFHNTTNLIPLYQVDVENPDLHKYPKFAYILDCYQECILTPGDALFIPPKFWHYVRSLSVSFSVSFWW